MDEREYPEGIDCIWIGIDCEGRLGVFVTGGEGPIPALALQTRRVLVEEIESRLLQLPTTTSTRLIAQLKRADDFIELARRGFFAYDWSDVHRTRSESIGKYELIAVPDVPLISSDLPLPIASLVESIELNANFAQEAFVDVRKLLQCRQPT